ncbi:hypothetical protein FGIG_04963 [Fasciola gigantica]|uniref:Sorting nexin protein WASP-binding domain-containing protein n=1 Tax=Fasciola gigantica TaxID=46835 RepID=A0A504Y5K5_FASGI|nr:hypothetical protein FGIG_04963 [Fasciola gigantica]
MSQTKSDEPTQESDLLVCSGFLVPSQLLLIFTPSPFHDSLACAEAAEKFAIEMERDTKILCDTLCDYHRKLSGAHAKDYSELSTACFRLCRSLETDVHTKDRNVTLIRALTGAGEAYKAIRIYHAAACEPTVVLLDCLRDFSRLFNGFPSVMCLGKCACISSDEADRLATEGKLSRTDATSIRTGSLVITRSVQAECNWIMEQLRAEYLTKFAEYLREQARFHRRIADQLDQAASLFQN